MAARTRDGQAVITEGKNVTGSLTLLFLYNLCRQDGSQGITLWAAHHFPLLVLYNSGSQTPEGLQAIQCKAYRLLRVAP